MSDKELREQIDIIWLWVTHTLTSRESVEMSIDEMMQLIKRYGVEQRLDERNHHAPMFFDTRCENCMENCEELNERIATLNKELEQGKVGDGTTK